jgi:hypothetical protein
LPEEKTKRHDDWTPLYREVKMKTAKIMAASTAVLMALGSPGNAKERGNPQAWYFAIGQFQIRVILPPEINNFLAGIIPVPVAAPTVVPPPKPKQAVKPPPPPVKQTQKPIEPPATPQDAPTVESPPPQIEPVPTTPDKPPSTSSYFGPQPKRPYQQR